MSRGLAAVVVGVVVGLSPSPAAAQGWIEPPPAIGGFAVEKVRSEVLVRMEGRVAEVEVTEWFRNGGRTVAEGHYLYPLPGEAVFQGFSLFQGETELRGEIMDADQARSIYEEIVRRRADPALIELAGHGLLRARVFPIEPGEERKVTLRYTQVLARAGNALQFVYAGGVRGGGGRTGPLDDGVATSFQMVAAEGDDFLDPFSPTHTLDVDRRDGELTVRVRGGISGRMALFFPLDGEAVGLSLATHRPVGEDGFFMLTLSPGRDVGRVEPRDVTVVLDVSGSMSGEKIRQAQSAVRGLLGTLAGDDRFRLVAFSGDVRRQSEGWSEARGGALVRARAWVDALRADGGTNLEGALEEAFRLESPAARLPVVIFLTDGLPSVGEQSPERLADRAQERAGRARVFAFGVGYDVNTHLLDRLGEAGRGSTEYVQPGEDVERAMSLLATKVQHPVLTDLELDGGRARLTEIYPVRIPDVFAGEELVLFGRYAGQGSGTVVIRGRRAGRAERFTAEGAFPRVSDANAYLPRLWASRKMGHLSRQIWTEGETPALVEEIRTLALRYGLPSPYTSYLVREPEVTADLKGVPSLLPGVADAAARGGRTRVAAAPSAASGATAVQMADEARRLREAVSVESLAAADERAASRLDADGDTGTRVVAGRIFRMEGGVWTEASAPADAEVVRIEAFSEAYFALLRALPEVQPLVRVLNPVRIAGARVVLEVGERGRTSVTEDQMRDIVDRFRQGSRIP